MAAIYHNGNWYGLGGSDVEANPQDSATDTLSKVGIDGTVYEVTDADAIHTSDIGTANGVAELDANGLVPSSQLPSYVDDVLEYASVSAFPATGETGKIYVALDTNLTYRWSGSAYVEISPSLALGETSSTAYRGDRGKTAYDHATESGRSGAKSAGLYKIGVTAQGHVASATPVAKSDLTALGVADQNDVDAIEADIEGFKTVTGKYLTINDAAALPAESYQIDLSPVQNLNGYDSPWVGGAGKNKFDIVSAEFNSSTIYGLSTSKDGEYTVLSGTWNKTGSASSTAREALYKANRVPYISGGAFKCFDLSADAQTCIDKIRWLTDGVGGIAIDLKNMVYGQTYSIRFKIMLYTGEEPTTYSPYSNICPIHGADEVGVRVCGKNIFDKTQTPYITGRYLGGNTVGNAIRTEGNANYNIYRLLISPNSYYTFGIIKANTPEYVFTDENDKVLLAAANQGGTDGRTITAQAPNNAKWLLLSVGVAGTYKCDDILQVEVGATPTTYEPYVLHSTTIPLPSTVYGGSVEMGGSGSVTYGYIDLGSLNWYTAPTSGGFYSEALTYPAKTPQAATEISNSKCSCYEIISAENWYYGRKNGATITGVGYGAAGRIGIFDSTQAGQTAAQFKTYVSGKYIAYPLATPTDISVTPFPQTLLEGVNNVWAEMKENSVVIDNAQQSLSYQPQNIVGELRQEIEAKPDSFAQLSDTSFSNLANGQIPKWNSTSQKWENANESGGGGASSLADLSDTNISSPADGQILKWDGTTSKWVNANEYSYSLPAADANTLGGIKVGSGLSINNSGVLSALGIEYYTHTEDITISSAALVTATMLSDVPAGKYMVFVRYQSPANNNSAVYFIVMLYNNDADSVTFISDPEISSAVISMYFVIDISATSTIKLQIGTSSYNPAKTLKDVNVTAIKLP